MIIPISLCIYLSSIHGEHSLLPKRASQWFTIRVARVTISTRYTCRNVGTTCDTLIPLSNYPRASLDSCQFFNSNGAETVINFGRIFSSIVETNFPSPSAREIIVDGVARMPCFLAIHIRSQLRNGLGLARCQRLSLWQTFARYTCWISVLNPYSLYGIFALLARDENFISFSPILFYVNAT